MNCILRTFVLITVTLYVTEALAIFANENNHQRMKRSTSGCRKRIVYIYDRNQGKWVEKTPFNGYSASATGRASNPPPAAEYRAPRVTNSAPLKTPYKKTVYPKSREYYSRPRYTTYNSDGLGSPIAIGSTSRNHLMNEHNKYRKMVIQKIVVFELNISLYLLFTAYLKSALFYARATNMHYMRWSDELARSAQSHANTCDFDHSKNRPHNTGENIWVAPYKDYSEAVFLWNDEVNDAACNCYNSYKPCCGHYTQLVNAETKEFGCAAAECNSIKNIYRRHRYILVCQYAPTGNRIIIGPGGYKATAAFDPQNGRDGACSKCPANTSCYQGLCY